MPKNKKPKTGNKLSNEPGNKTQKHKTKTLHITKKLIPLTLLALTLNTIPQQTSLAAYTSNIIGNTPTTGTNTLTTTKATYLPTTTYIANTATAIQDGTLWIWGYRGNGLSGTGTQTIPSTAPPSAAQIPQNNYTGTNYNRHITKVAGVSLDNYYETDANYTGLAALSDDGIVYTWGGLQSNNIMGRTDTNYYTPTPTNIPGKVTDLKSSSGVFMALTDTGDLYTWGNPQGRGITGQSATNSNATTPTPTKILSGVHSIGSGTWNGWAIVGNYNPSNPNTGVFWWGWANNGAYAGDPSGDNIGNSVYFPKRSNTLSTLATSGCNTVGIVANSTTDTCTLRSLTGHYYGSQAITSDGKIRAWGSSGNMGTGRAGGSTDNIPTILNISGSAAITNTAVTEDYVLLLDSTGKIYVYGRFSYASGINPTTGARSTTNIITPTLITALPSPAAQIGGFGYTGVARLTNGTYYMWGGSAQGGNNNPYNSIRNDWTNTTTPTSPGSPLTIFTQPGV